MVHCRRGFIAAGLLLGLTLPVQAQRGPVAAALMQFESAVTWEAVETGWSRSVVRIAPGRSAR